MSFASEFSGFGDSDSESSGSDGYSVKEGKRLSVFLARTVHLYFSLLISCP
uniref:Uncharacterized protein n=1 Tax=Setaria italica TaxID=4555 RepID=K3YP26_SETIT